MVVFWYFLVKFEGFGERGAPGPSLGSIWGCIWGARGGLGVNLGCPGEALGAIWAALGLILGTLEVILMVSGGIWEPPGAQVSKNT